MRLKLRSSTWMCFFLSLHPVLTTVLELLRYCGYYSADRLPFCSASIHTLRAGRCCSGFRWEAAERRLSEPQARARAPAAVGRFLEVLFCLGNQMRPVWDVILPGDLKRLCKDALQEYHQDKTCLPFLKSHSSYLFSS